MEWLNEPEVWHGDADALWLETDANTDFWRDTFYGFTRDSGHALLTPVTGDFSAEVRFRGKYETLYDQAGLLLRTGATDWIKAGVEYTDGVIHFSTVVTNGRSDWSVIPLGHLDITQEIGVRITRHGDAVRIQYDAGDAGWRMARLAPFNADQAMVGPMACSPERGGFKASFTGVSVGRAIPRDLHG